MPAMNDIQQEILNVLSVAEELDDSTEQLPAMEYLEKLAIQEQSKADAIGYAVRKRKAEIQFLKEEEQRLKKRRHSMERRMEEFKEYLLFIFQKYNLQRVKGLSSTLSIRTVHSVNIEDTESLPEQYKQTISDIKLDKQGLSKALKNGEEIAGANLEKRPSLVIR